MAILIAATAASSTLAAACGLGSSGDDATADNALSSACAGASEDQAPDDLACTGLYADFGAKTIAPSARAFAPAVSFWSDGFEKDRFISLPDGAPIDGSNVDDWKFPVGTKAWKEIRQGQRKIETRFFWKVKADRWVQAAYVWSEDGTKAVRGEGTDVTVNGSPYHVPKSDDCTDCHHGRKDKILGFEAISLAQPAATGLNLSVLVAEQRIAPPPPRTTVTLPQPGLGVLHINCGVTCHNGTGAATASITGLRLRLGFDEVINKPPATWEAVVSSVGVDAKMPGWDGEIRVKPGLPEESLIITVMKLRGQGQMPPIATTKVDEQGVSSVEQWIRALPPSSPADGIDLTKILAR